MTGGRASAALAALLASMLRYLGLQVQELLPGACDYYDRLMTVRPDDLVITICFSRYTAQIAEGAAFLHAHDVPIVLMTDLEPSPLYACPFCTRYAARSAPCAGRTPPSTRGSWSACFSTAACSCDAGRVFPRRTFCSAFIKYPEYRKRCENS